MTGYVLDKKKNMKTLFFKGRGICQYWQSNGNKSQKIFLLVGCSNWGVKILSPQGSTFQKYTGINLKLYSSSFSILESKKLVLQWFQETVANGFLDAEFLCFSWMGHGLF
jgi:hypothetical protein